MPNANYRRGAKRELDVKARYEAHGYTVVRSAGSKGAGDLVAGKAGYKTWLIEVKSTKRPFDTFPPADREALAAAADRAGWEPLLVWWPPDREGIRFIPKEGWPDGR